jgi:prepilin-type N-terminal cleavage/methylation domain-containing protein
MMIEHNSKGFTMIELITVIVVLSILSLFTFSFMDNAIKTHMLTREQSALYSEGAYIMERITRELSDATTVTAPPTGSTSNTLTFNKVHPSAIAVTFAQSGRDLTRNGVIMGRNIIKTFDVTRNAAVAPPTGTGDETITVVLELNSPTDTSMPGFSSTTKITPNNYGTANYTGRSFNGDYDEVIQ